MALPVSYVPEVIEDVVNNPTLDISLAGTPHSLFGALMPAMILKFLVNDYTPRTAKTLENKSEYDYIIVGAGAAGSVVAGRLSEKKCVSVLLLEAGPTPTVLTEIPGISRLFVGTEIDWKYLTVRQEHCAGALNNRQVLWPGGKAIGGSSVINAMLFVRGHRSVFDNWEKEGATGWNYKEMLRYFKKLETYIKGKEIDPDVHGYHGPINATRPNYYPSLKQAVFEAATNMGYKIVDNNGYNERGFTNHTGTIREGLRCSAAKAYLVPAQDRSNLRIVNKAFVKRILVENVDTGRGLKKRAAGVVVDHEGKEKTIWAKREVLVAAGAVNSAKLLLVSGIGPAEHLHEHRIQVHANLPVGYNFQDHPASFAAYTIDGTPYLNKLLNPSNVLDFLTQRKGPWASTESVENIAFLTNNEHAKPDAVPDQALYIAEGVPLAMKVSMNMKREEFDRTYGYYKHKNTAWCVSSLLHPLSRGRVSLASSNPYDDPLIDPNYYAVNQDLIDVATGLKYCDRIFNNKALRNGLNARPFNKTFTECECLELRTNEYYQCVARAHVFTTSHPAGTLKMGHPDSETTVVRPSDLRVKGFTNLRAVDASVMPLVTGGNTYVPTMAVAEKASDIIKRDIREC